MSLIHSETPPGEFGTRGGSALSLRSGLQFVEGVLQVLGGDAALVGERARRQGVMGDAVDLPRQPAGGVEQRLCGGRLKTAALRSPPNFRGAAPIHPSRT